MRPCDAYTAIDDSMKNAAICHYDISFGGRRAFCREKYFDLGKLGFDNNFVILKYTLSKNCQIQSKLKINHFILLTDNSGHGFCDEKTSPQKSQTIVNTDDDSFDVLLRKVKEKMQEKK